MTKIYLCVAYLFCTRMLKTALIMFFVFFDIARILLRSYSLLQKITTLRSVVGVKRYTSCSIWGSLRQTKRASTRLTKSLRTLPRTYCRLLGLSETFQSLSLSCDTMTWHTVTLKAQRATSLWEHPVWSLALPRHPWSFVRCHPGLMINNTCDDIIVWSLPSCYCNSQQGPQLSWHRTVKGATKWE